MTRIGYLVKKICADGGLARVLGRTSRGVYLSTPSRWVVFCSGERFSSPITLNVFGIANDFERVVVGMGAQFEVDQLRIPDAGVLLRFENGLEWIPSEPIDQPISKPRTIERLESLMSLVLNIKESNAEVAEPLDPWVSGGVDRLEEALSRRLGLGEGLTPSGDDFVNGFLLAMNRYRRFLWEYGDLDRLNHQIVSAAYQKTTRLSANLIELATWGESDERLLNAVDYLQGADYVLGDIAADLSGWGHTSGVAVLAGMATAYKIQFSG